LKNYNNDWLAANQILILNSNTLNIQNSFSTFYFYTSINSFIVFNTKNTLEIIVAVADININPIQVRGKLVCYNANNSIKWISDQNYGGSLGQGGTLSSADFNQDGISEVYIHNNIFNSTNGIYLLVGEIMAWEELAKLFLLPQI
jgi:hypothetical protein